MTEIEETIKTADDCELDEEMTVAEYHEQLVDAGRRAMEAEQRIGAMETRFYRLLHTCEMLLAGRATMDSLAGMVKEVRA